MSINKFLVITSFIWKLLERSGTQIILFIVTIILARLLTPDDYGTVALVMVLISLATVFVEGGLNTALIQKKDSDQTDFSTIFYFSIFISFIVYILVYISAPFIAIFYGKPELELVVKILGICLFFNAVNSVQRAYLYKKMLFKKLFLSSFTGAVISASIGIYMAYQGFGIWSLVVQQLVLSALTTLVMWLTVKWRPILAFSKTRFFSLFNFGWKIFLSNLSISLFVNIRSLIIGRIYNPSSLAYFDRGKHFPSLIMDNINSSIQAVMFPILSKEQDDVDVVKIMVKKSTQVSSYILYPILLLLAVVAEPLTLILLTEKWIDIVPFIQIFCIANILTPIQNVNIEAIKSLGYSDITLKLELVKKVIEVTILVISVFIGVKAIAWGVVVYNGICIYINLYPCKKLYNYGIIEQLKDNMTPCILSIITALILVLLKLLELKPWEELILSTSSSIIIYIILSEMFKVTPYLYLKKIVLKH